MYADKQCGVCENRGIPGGLQNAADTGRIASGGIREDTSHSGRILGKTEEDQTTKKTTENENQKVNHG